MRQLLCILMFFYLLAPIVSAQTGKSANRLNFELIDGFIMVVKVSVNEKERSFLFDTGASATAISSELATELKLMPSGKTKLLTSAGTSEVELTKVGMSFGKSSFKDVPVLIADLSAIKKYAPQVEGVLGNNILKNLNFLVDYQSLAIQFEDADEIGGKITGTVLQFNEVDGRMVIHGISREGVKRTFVLDSAAIKPIVFVSKIEVSDGSLSSVNGETKMQHIRFDYKVGSELIAKDGLSMVATNYSGDGLLPTNLFKSFYVNNQYQIVILNPRLN